MSRTTRISARPPPPPPPPLARGANLTSGARLGSYELVHRIAVGGMAEVWVAEHIGDLGFRRRVALKTILPQYAFDKIFRSMFIDEAHIASRIYHANVVEVLDLCVVGDAVFQAMSLVNGTSLASWLTRTPKLEAGAAIRIVVDMLRGLHATHSLRDAKGDLLGVVHRDVSPQNVLISVDGIAKLADFGIAKAVGCRETEETFCGEVKGKVGYLAPELFVGARASAQSDIYSAGVVLWEVLTGRHFVDSFTSAATCVHERAASLGEQAAVQPIDSSEHLNAIVMRALAHDPAARFASAADMADELELAAKQEQLDTSSRHLAATLEADRQTWGEIGHAHGPIQDLEDEATTTTTTVIIVQKRESTDELDETVLAELSPPTPSQKPTFFRHKQHARHALVGVLVTFVAATVTFAGLRSLGYASSQDAASTSTPHDRYEGP